MEIKELKYQLIEVNNEELIKSKRKRDIEEFITKIIAYGDVFKLT